MVSSVNLGKRKHKVRRFVSGANTGKWIDGEWVDAGYTIVDIYANLQPAFSFNQTKLLPEGDRDKVAIWGSSNHWVYTADSSNSNIKQPDQVEYRGALWEIKAVAPYGNFGEHCEFVAIKLNDLPIDRVTGIVGKIN